MFSKGNKKDKRNNSTSSNKSNTDSNISLGHRRNRSNASLAATLPEFGDLHSLSSENSFPSLKHVKSSSSFKSPTQWKFNSSAESLHSLPNVKISNQSKNKGIMNFKNSNKKENIKNRKFFQYKNDKNNRKFGNSNPPSMGATTIMEDDENEHILSVPTLPNFKGPGRSGSGIPKPEERSESEPAQLNPTHTDSFQSDYPQLDSDNLFADKNDSHDQYLKSTIDQDFDVSFLKDSEMSRGEYLFELRRKKGLPQRRNIKNISSSDDDTSTEGESENESLPKFAPYGDDDKSSVKSESSRGSNKMSFKNFFRKRAFSLGSESVKSDKSTKSVKSTKSKKSNETAKSFESKRSRKSFVNETDHDSNPDSFFHSQKNIDRIPAKFDGMRNDDLVRRDNGSLEEKSNTAHEINYQREDTHASSDFDEKDIQSIASSSKNVDFFKKIFTLDGLLGQGGLAPSANLNYQPESSPYDEEHIQPNFQEEIKQEAQVLVNHMFKNPVDELRNRKTTRERESETQEAASSNFQDLNTDMSTNSGIFGSSTSVDRSAFYVPDHAHLALDPFDDLQDVHNFSIDVPDNITEKPRKYKAGVQSALFQLYNTHFLPSSASASMNQDLRSMATTESDFNDSTYEKNGLNMNLGDAIKKNGLNGLRGNYPEATLDTEMPELGTKMEEFSEDAEVQLDRLKIPKFHKRASSVQDFIFHPEKKLQSAANKKIPSKRKSDVKFQLPNFETKPKNESSYTAYEKEEILGYKNLKKRARFNKRLKSETTARITVHIADVLERQRFILTLCKAFMLYGAPTHRLEEYMSMTAQVLEIDGSFIYFPGCMIVSFGDLNSRTSEMKLVRCAQGLNLAKLDEVHDVYKNVVHDRLGTVEGYKMLDEIMNRKPRFNAWWCIFFYALSSLAVAPWSFGGSWIDLPICFGIGGIIGFLQFVVSPRNTLYSSVFEVSSSIITSFIARAIGSINGGNTFCYAALVQSPLALILPGYIILCGSLELQSRNIVAGSVRMFYAFIYSLMLSFGITLGAALYGWIDENATSTTSCTSNISPWFRFLFIPMFTIGIALTNQASWSQLPMMSIISGCGYVVTYFSSLHFKEITELNATLGCFIIGLVSNIYSRMLKSFNKYFTTRGTFMTVSLMLPAIFVQVPSGIASQGSVFTGISTANSIVHSNSSDSSSSLTNTSSLSFGMVMIQVALGISVGLYLSTILVYPFGKKRTGLFTL